MTILDHLEHHLGAMSVGWKGLESGNTCPFIVAKFDRGPTSDSLIFSTIGLSDDPLVSPVSQKLIRHELVLMIRGDNPKNVPSLLQQVGMQSLATRTPLLRGDVIHRAGTVFANTAMVALYVTIPVYFPEAFRTCNIDDSSIIFAWLVPITHDEVHYIQKFGWDSFEDKLEQCDQDLIDINRVSIV